MSCTVRIQVFYSYDNVFQIRCLSYTLIYRCICKKDSRAETFRLSVCLSVCLSVYALAMEGVLHLKETVDRDMIKKISGRSYIKVLKLGVLERKIQREKFVSDETSKSCFLVTHLEVLST